MHRTLIIGNWKMNLDTMQASLLVHRLEERIRIHRDIEVVLAPSLLVLQPLSLQIDRRKFRLAAQNAYFKDQGAFTGEVSFAMLRDLVHYVIVGHSERRTYFHESLEIVRDKVTAAVRNGIIPILCVGETQVERREGETDQVLHDQLITALSDLTSEDMETLVVAYEPTWAISSGHDFAHHEVPKPQEIERIARLIRHNITELYGKKTAEAVRVVYGGSSNAENALSFLSINGINGLLPGGASLDYQQFSGIVDAAYRLKNSVTMKEK